MSTFGACKPAFFLHLYAFGAGMSAVGTFVPPFDALTSAFGTLVPRFGARNSAFGTGVPPFGAHISAFSTLPSSPSMLKYQTSHLIDTVMHAAMVKATPSACDERAGEVE
jgi:hypothetical protein